MFWLVTQMWLFLLVAFGLGAVAGAWIAGARKKAPKALRDVEAAPGRAMAPALLTAPDGAKDDLTQIIGVDRATEKKLNALGVFHLRQIAEWDDGAARWVEMRLNEPGRVARERWAEQSANLG